MFKENGNITIEVIVNFLIVYTTLISLIYVLIYSYEKVNLRLNLISNTNINKNTFVKSNKNISYIKEENILNDKYYISINNKKKITYKKDKFINFVNLVKIDYEGVLKTIVKK